MTSADSCVGCSRNGLSNYTSVVVVKHPEIQQSIVLCVAHGMTCTITLRLWLLSRQKDNS